MNMSAFDAAHPSNYRGLVREGLRGSGKQPSVLMACPRKPDRPRRSAELVGCDRKGKIPSGDHIPEVTLKRSRKLAVIKKKCKNKIRTDLEKGIF